ncbi:CPBP family intramembrane metalloprotease [Bacillus sp. ISL-41]|uniref:CPBP family intramembrane glutamic endopeptidase n=1 Tax=Bacillus sp. ISL-41 TaxID=2819127 RepID=UPI001BE61DFF|nr:CPBP family intramembrane glutamic endopeptidase [Bacillus sp. ISL-41]MBT2644725.1 CPBP family intramembrane metalloprotease [Bacillus sp. ISL-41]
MLGILVQLIISWVLLRVFYRENLGALGITPTKSRISQLALGFIFTALLCTVIQLVDSALTNTDWKLNENLSVLGTLNFLWWNVTSVVFEELIFRGALLYIVIRKWGARTGIILSAIVFGIYHWFSFGVVGNIVLMLVVFLMTSISGLVWAYAFEKSKSMMLPIGLHLGWNFVFNSVFSKGPLGDQILIPQVDKAHYLTDTLSFFIQFLLPNLVVPALTFLFVKFILKKNAKKPL